MKRFAIIISALLIALTYAYPQQKRPNSISLSIGGNGIIYSINYERIIHEHFSVNIGGGLFTATEKGTGKNFQIYTIPATAGYIHNLSGNRHFVEAGFGMTPVLISSTMNSYIRENDLYIIPTLNIGYRFHCRNFLLKLAFTPYCGTKPLNDKREKQNAFSITGSQIQPWGGITVGYRF